MNVRRWFVLAGSLSIIVSSVTALYSYAIAPRWLQVKRLRVGIIGLPEEWRGVRIAFLSDFHVGHSGVSVDMLWNARQVALDYEPDIIALTGDFYDAGFAVDHGGLYSDWPQDRTFAVLGNHDHRGGEHHLELLARELDEGNIRLLGNEAICLELRGRRAWIAAVDDPYSFHDDLALALDGIPTGEEALVLLAHAPTAAEDMPVGCTRLVLTGHTHGGQIRLLPSGKTPFLGLIHWVLGEPPRNEPSIYHGEHWVRGAVVCISNGLGMSQLPLRFRTRPQVILIELDDVAASMEPCDGVQRYVSDETREPRWMQWLA